MAKLINKHFRLTEKQCDHLARLSAKTGYTASEILRMMIDNVDEVDLSQSIKHQQAVKNREMNILARQKYLLRLYSNVSTNLNQIAKYVNGVKGIDSNTVNQFNKMSDLLTKLRSDINEHFKGN